MTTEKRGVVLVGHGGIPRDCPQELVTRLKRLEAQRREDPIRKSKYPRFLITCGRSTRLSPCAMPGPLICNSSQRR